jgi:hypothetical protein
MDVLPIIHYLPASSLFVLPACFANFIGIYMDNAQVVTLALWGVEGWASWADSGRTLSIVVLSY